MCSTKPSLLILLLTISASLYLGSAQRSNPSRYHAAKCIYLAKNCTQRLVALTNNLCVVDKLPYQQRGKCRALACRWCALKSNTNSKICKHWRLKKTCRAKSPQASPTSIPDTTIPTSSPLPSISVSPSSSVPTSPSPSSSKSPQPNVGGDKSSASAGGDSSGTVTPTNIDGKTILSNCTWTASNAEGDIVVVDLGRVPLVRDWSRTKRGNYTGIVYKEGGDHHIDGKKQSIETCFPIQVAVSGRYFFTALSYAPHGSEFNDCFARSPKLGFSLWKAGKQWFPTAYSSTDKMKAYQNNGARGMIVSLKHKDHDGHRFLINGVEKGKAFKVCISGRSKRFEMFKLIFIKCFGDHCTGKPFWEVGNLPIEHLPYSKCIPSST